MAATEQTRSECCMLPNDKFIQAKMWLCKAQKWIGKEIKKGKDCSVFFQSWEAELSLR